MIREKAAVAIVVRYKSLEMREVDSRVAIVTGVSRRRGIGFAIARRLLQDGLKVVIHSWSSHDADQPWAPGPDEQSAESRGWAALVIASSTSRLTSPTWTPRGG